MRALIGSVEVGVKRVGEIVARFGADVIEDALALLLERTRRLVRGKLAENFAYGTHSFTDAIDGDGHGSGPLHLRLSLTREKAAPARTGSSSTARRRTTSRSGLSIS